MTKTARVNKVEPLTVSDSVWLACGLVAKSKRREVTAAHAAAAASGVEAFEPESSVADAGDESHVPRYRPSNR